MFALVLGVSLAGVGPQPAVAQGFGFLGNLFGGGAPQNAPAYPGGSSGGGGSYGSGNSDAHYYRPRHHAARHKARPDVEQAQDNTPPKPKTPPKNATVFVDVFGDSLGQMLAGGLDDALADRAEVGVIHRAKGSTGLVNTSYYDWQKTIDGLLASKDPKDKIDVAVMMIGVNDRQPIVQDGKTLKPGTDEWRAVYAKRVAAIDEAFAKKKVPLVWVGVPITKDDDFADDMAALNDIYRDAAAKTGATYVDTWEPFSDDNGDFAAYGPDINGQTMRLRSSDGIHFTKAGARKLAHFVEAHVRRDLDGKAPLPELPTAEAPATDTKAPGAKTGAKEANGKAAGPVVKPEAGPIRNLGELPAAKDGELAQVPKAAARKSTDPADYSLAKGETGNAPYGRADNFRWVPEKTAPAQ